MVVRNSKFTEQLSPEEEPQHVSNTVREMVQNTTHNLSNLKKWVLGILPWHINMPDRWIDCLKWWHWSSRPSSRWHWGTFIFGAATMLSMLAPAFCQPLSGMELVSYSENGGTTQYVGLTTVSLSGSSFNATAAVDQASSSMTQTLPPAISFIRWMLVGNAVIFITVASTCIHNGWELDARGTMKPNQEFRMAPPLVSAAFSVYIVAAYLVGVYFGNQIVALIRRWGFVKSPVTTVEANIGIFFWSYVSWTACAVAWAYCMHRRMAIEFAVFLKEENRAHCEARGISQGEKQKSGETPADGD